MVRLADGTVWMCGQNDHGQLGIGTTTDSDVFVKVPLPAAATFSYDGGSAPDNGSAIVLLANGDVYAWGDNSRGQLGDGRTTRKPVKVPVEATALPSGHTWKAVATGGATSYVVDSAGDEYAFGNNAQGEVGGGTGDVVITPVLVLSGGVKLISSTADDALATVS
jgi:alpha-tubulin suppressor-like RCC1 family protein